MYVANMTRFGRYIYGYGGNPESAKLAGINVKRVIIISFALIGALTAVGAGLVTTIISSGSWGIDQMHTNEAVSGNFHKRICSPALPANRDRGRATIWKSFFPG